jgi:hypothetical protein
MSALIVERILRKSFTGSATFMRSTIIAARKNHQPIKALIAYPLFSLILRDPGVRLASRMTISPEPAKTKGTLS